MKSKFIVLIIGIVFSVKGAELGFISKGSFTKVCEGAYISHDRFVTAAHCLATLNALFFDFEIEPSVKDGDEFYPVLNFWVSKKFRDRLDEGIHDDLALVETPTLETREFLNVSTKKNLPPEIIVSTPHFKNESGRALLDKDGSIWGVLSRRYKHGGSVYTTVTEEILDSLN